MRRFPVILLALALCALIARDAGADTVGRGDFNFYLDNAAFRGRDGRVLEEVYVRVPNSEVRFVEHEGAWRARLRLSVEILTLDGEPVVQDAETMEFVEPNDHRTSSSLYFQTIVKRYHLPPGVYSLSYAIEDLESPKMTVVGMMKDRNALSSVRGMRLHLPEIVPGEAAFSQPKFVWSVDELDGHREYHPNAQRLYGLYKDTLMVYMELYLPDEMASSPSFEFQSVLVNSMSEEIKVSTVRLDAPSGASTPDGIRTYPILITADLAKFPAGTYTQYVSFAMDGATLSRVRTGNFSVAWDLRTWEVPRREMMAEARFLLGDEEFEAFRHAPKGEQEVQLDGLWKSFDPTPETVANEAYTKFLARLAYINEHYSDHGPAIRDPRGQVFMRYGPPDEVIQDVIPLNRDTVTEAIQMVEDPYYAMNFSSYGVKMYHNSAGRNTIIDPRGLGANRAGDNVGYPFELWVYQREGDPILERDMVAEIGIGMRYLFIDRDGYGRYKLESSSSISTK